MKNLQKSLKLLIYPLNFCQDSLDIDERPRFELEDNVKLIVIKTPTENNSFNESDAYYITIPICIILTHNQIVTVNSFENGAIKKFLNTFPEPASRQEKYDGAEDLRKGHADFHGIP